MSTQQFFSDTVMGLRNKPRRPWSPKITVPFQFQEYFNEYKGDFDEHIATSIPLYREMLLITGQAILDIYGNLPAPYIVDIGGSEGSWVKALSHYSNIVSAVIDCNKEMKEIFYRNNSGYSCFRLESFLESYGDIQKHIPRFKADIVHAGMAFQFMPFKREDCIKEVVDNYLKMGGLFLIEEKVITDNWDNNEQMKDSYKSIYYSSEDLATKKNEIVNTMNSSLVSESYLEILLRSNFRNCYKYFNSGNFVGYACSDSEYVLNNFKRKVGVIN